MSPGILAGGLALLLVWGAWGLIAKFALRELELQAVIWNQLASLTLLPVYFLVFREMLPLKFAWTGIGWALLAGLLGAGGTLILYLLLRAAPASVVIPISALYPVVTVILSIFILGEKLSWQQGVGLVLAVSAIWLLSSNDTR